MSAADLKTPLKHARGLGSAHYGAHHFIVQRITSIALIPIGLWSIWFALALIHADYAQARVLVAHPFNAVMLSALVILMFWHAQLGMQVVFEDYVTPRWREVMMQLLMKAFCFLGALTCLIAIVRISLGPQ
jgi:succinate dehydrogenase / fumarate reductase membrane anchor subunit